MITRIQNRYEILSLTLKSFSYDVMMSLTSLTNLSKRITKNNGFTSSRRSR